MSRLDATEREHLARANLDPDDPKVEQAVFGREVTEFLGSRVGQYLIVRAREELEEVKEALTTERDLKAVRRLQSQAAICNRVCDWLRDAIIAGRNAENALQQQRDTDA